MAWRAFNLGSAGDSPREQKLIALKEVGVFFGSGVKIEGAGFFVSKSFESFWERIER